ncbi:hypothetical protein [Streptomyces sp. NPDC001389]|uniref:hypothetical protein n=1 Tax=Streptomyces sp. NPDC001389 TaxID=3364569 RepID=UPI0036B39687
MSTTRRLLGTGPRPLVEDHGRTDGRRNAVERAAAADTADTPSPRETQRPAQSTRRSLGDGPRTAEE